jgi:PDZ domain-containing secreted protein
VQIARDPLLGFGFVVGSEKPVLIRCVNDGPSTNKLLPGDQIIEVNGQNVQKANQEHVIQLIK